jgi:hypothetical protein
LLIFNQLQRTAVAPPHARWAGRNSTKIALQGKAGLSFNKKRFLRAGGTTDQTHIINLIADDDVILGRAGGINKWSGNSRKINTSLSKHPDTGSSGIGNSSHMIEGAGYFAMPATRTFGMVNLYPRHP